MIRDATPDRQTCRFCRRYIVMVDGVWRVDLGGIHRVTCRWTRSKTERAHVPLTPPAECASI